MLNLKKCHCDEHSLSLVAAKSSTCKLCHKSILSPNFCPNFLILQSNAFYRLSIKKSVLALETEGTRD